MGEEGGQIVFSGNDLPAGTSRTSCAVLAARQDGGLPFMPLLTPPPDLFVCAGCHRVGGQGTVLLWVPLACKLRVGGGQIVFPGDYDAVCTGGTARSVYAGPHLGVPLVAFCAAPPDFPLCAGGHARGRNPRIFSGMPLCCDGRISVCQRMAAWRDARSGAVGAAGAAACPGVDCGLPLMPLLAAPPYLPVAAMGNMAGTEYTVLFFVPLAEQIFFLLLDTMVI